MTRETRGGITMNKEPTRGVQFVSDERGKIKITQAYTHMVSCEHEVRRVNARVEDAQRQLKYLIGRYSSPSVDKLVSFNRDAIMEYITEPDVEVDSGG